MNLNGGSSKLDLTPRRHHGYSVFLFILGTLFPPLAVAARFGIGSDFWLNLLLTICGYIPGHVHNFYIQNIRNNKNHRRTPKWAQRYGLVDTTKIERNRKRSQWAARYNERLPHSTLEGAQLAEGEIDARAYGNGNSNGGGDDDDNFDLDSIADPEERERARAAKAQGQKYWRAEDERYYGASAAAGRGSQGSLESGSTYPNSGAGAGAGGRWHYPANFEDSLPSDIYGGNGNGNGVAGDGAPGSSSRRKKSKKDKSGSSSRGKKDRWERTEAAYSSEMLDAQAQKPKKKKKSRKGSHYNSSTVGGGGYGDDDRRSSTGTSVDEPGFPEDAEGGLYGERREGRYEVPSSTGAPTSTGRVNDELEHEF